MVGMYSWLFGNIYMFFVCLRACASLPGHVITVRIGILMLSCNMRNSKQGWGITFCCNLLVGSIHGGWLSLIASNKLHWSKRIMAKGYLYLVHFVKTMMTSKALGFTFLRILMLKKWKKKILLLNHLKVCRIRIEEHKCNGELVIWFQNWPGGLLGVSGWLVHPILFPLSFCLAVFNWWNV